MRNGDAARATRPAPRGAPMHMSARVRPAVALICPAAARARAVRRFRQLAIAAHPGQCWRTWPSSAAACWRSNASVAPRSCSSPPAEPDSMIPDNSPLQPAQPLQRACALGRQISATFPSSSTHPGPQAPANQADRRGRLTPGGNRERRTPSVGPRGRVGDPDFAGLLARSCPDSLACNLDK